MNGLSNPRFDGVNLIADCGGKAMNVGIILKSMRRPGIMRIVDAQDGISFMSFAEGNQPLAKEALNAYVAWQDRA